MFNFVETTLKMSSKAYEFEGGAIRMKYKLARQINAYKKRLLLGAVICYVVERPVDFFLGIGNWNPLYMFALFTTVYFTLEGLFHLIFRKQIDATTENGKFWVNTTEGLVLLLMLMLIYGSITGVYRGAMHYVKTIYYEPRVTSERDIYSEDNWDNFTYYYMRNFQVFDVAAEEVIDYEDYVRRFQEGSYYSEVHHKDTGILEIQKDGQPWFSTKLKEQSVENPYLELLWSPKRTYLLINYGAIQSDMVDVRNKTILPCPMVDSIFEPYEEAKGREISVSIYPEWNAEENRIIINYYPENLSYNSRSKIGWDIGLNQYRLHNIRGSNREESLYFDGQGQFYVGKNYRGKWVDEDTILYLGTTGRILSFADGWGGGRESGVEVYDRQWNEKRRTYPSHYFDTLSLDNLHGYVIRDGYILKYRYRWF